MDNTDTLEAAQRHAYDHDGMDGRNHFSAVVLGYLSACVSADELAAAIAFANKHLGIER